MLYILKYLIMNIIKIPVLTKHYLNLIYGLLLGKSFILNNNNEIKLIIVIESKHSSYFTFIKNTFNISFFKRVIFVNNIFSVKNIIFYYKNYFYNYKKR